MFYYLEIWCVKLKWMFFFFFLTWCHQFAPNTCLLLHSLVSCHFSHITTYSPSFYLTLFTFNPHVTLLITSSLSTFWHPLSPSLLVSGCLASPILVESDLFQFHFAAILGQMLQSSSSMTPSLLSQGWGWRPCQEELASTCHPTISHFLLLPACLIKLPPSYMHTSQFLNQLLSTLLFYFLHELFCSCFQVWTQTCHSLSEECWVCISVWIICRYPGVCAKRATHYTQECRFILIKFPSSFQLPSCVPALPTLQMSTGPGHMEWHLVPHHPMHMDTKNLTACRVNLERCQADSYSLVKRQSSARSAARPPASTLAHTHTNAGTFNPQWHSVMTARQKGLALPSRSLPPAHTVQLPCSPQSHTVISIPSVTVCWSGLHSLCSVFYTSQCTSVCPQRLRTVVNWKKYCLRTCMQPTPKKVHHS